MKRLRVALVPPRTMHDFANFARVVATRLSEDPIFSPPATALAALPTQIAALEAALATSLTRTLGASAARKAKQRAVLASLQTLQAYVQSLANTLPTDEAVMVVKLAGMAVKNVRGPSRPALTVKPGRVTGTAHAYARAAKTRAGYEWQIALDGVTWGASVFTLHADVALDGLTPGALIRVRARAVVAEGETEWVGPVAFRVV